MSEANKIDPSKGAENKKLAAADNAKPAGSTKNANDKSGNAKKTASFSDISMTDSNDSIAADLVDAVMALNGPRSRGRSRQNDFEICDECADYIIGQPMITGNHSRRRRRRPAARSRRRTRSRSRSRSMASRRRRRM